MKPSTALLLILAGLAGTARADDILWLGAEFPPMAMTQGPHARQGYINALFDYLQRQLPQHRFTEQMLPWPRAMHMAQQGGPYCLIAAFKTPEREVFLRFSEPYGYLLPLGLIGHQVQADALAPYLNGQGQVELERLLANPRLRPGIASGRSYGRAIDTLLGERQASTPDGVTRIYQGESTRTLFEMLELRRIDYSFGYPSEIGYYSASRHLRFYPVAGSDQLLPGRFSCTRSPETDRVFADLQRLMRNGEHQAVFLASYERWLPKALREFYRQRLVQLPKP